MRGILVQYGLFAFHFVTHWGSKSNANLSEMF